MEMTTNDQSLQRNLEPVSPARSGLAQLDAISKCLMAASPESVLWECFDDK